MEVLCQYFCERLNEYCLVPTRRQSRPASGRCAGRGKVRLLRSMRCPTARETGFCRPRRVQARIKTERYMDPPAIEKPLTSRPVAFRLSLTTVLMAGGNYKRAVSTGLTCDAVLSSQGVIGPKQEGGFTSNAGKISGEGYRVSLWRHLQTDVASPPRRTEG